MKYAYLTISILLLGYVLACAFIVPLTVDEGWTFDAFIMQRSAWEVVSYSFPVANNHILNSLLAKVFVMISPHEVFLRMPNILSFILYTYAAYKIPQLYTQNKWIQLAFFLSLLFNTILIHFFALCRGYGLSIGLLLFSIYQLMLVTQNGWRKINMHLAFIAATAAVYASFTLVYVFVPLVVWAILINLYSHKGRPGIIRLSRALAIPMLYTFIVLALCYYPIRQLSIHNELYYGGSQNFIDDTLYTLMEDLVGYAFISHHKRLVLVALLLPLSAAFVITLFKGFSKRNLLYVFCPSLLFFCIVAINLHFYLSGSKLLISRTALFLYPLIILTFFSAICKAEHAIPNFSRVAAICIGLVLAVFFVAQINFRVTRDWWFDAYNKKALSAINRYTKKTGYKTRLYVYNLCANSINYYIETRKYHIETTLDNSDIADENLSAFDFLYLKSGEHTPPAGFKLVASYGEGNFLLYANTAYVD